MDLVQEKTSSLTKLAFYYRIKNKTNENLAGNYTYYILVCYKLSSPCPSPKPKISLY